MDVAVSNIQDRLKQISGLNGEPVILLSFAWYIFNVYTHVKYGLSLSDDAKSFGGFDSIEAFMLSAVFFTFAPHLLCIEKGKHYFFGTKFLNDAIIIIPAFLLHYVLSGVILR